MAKKETSPKLSKLASEVLSGRKKPTKAEILSLAASVMGQDETAGQTAKPKTPKKKP